MICDLRAERPHGFFSRRSHIWFKVVGIASQSWFNIVPDTCISVRPRAAAFSSARVVQGRAGWPFVHHLRIGRLGSAHMIAHLFCAVKLAPAGIGDKIAGVRFYFDPGRSLISDSLQRRLHCLGRRRRVSTHKAFLFNPGISLRKEAPVVRRAFARRD